MGDNKTKITSPFQKYDIVKINIPSVDGKKVVGLITGVNESPISLTGGNVYLYDVSYIRDEGNLEKGQFSDELLTLIHRQENHITNIPRFKFSDSVEFGDLREPNRSEIIGYMLNVLSGIYVSMKERGYKESYHVPYPMSTSSYYTFKGQIKRNQFEPFIRYMEKRGYDIRSGLEEYKKSKTIMPIKYSFTSRELLLN